MAKPLLYKEDKHPIDILEFNKIMHGVFSDQCAHPTRKPIDLNAYLIHTYTNEGEVVLDFCMGSGTAMVAAHRLKRRGIGIELHRPYYEMVVQRMHLETRQARLL